MVKLKFDDKKGADNEEVGVSGRPDKPRGAAGRIVAGAAAAGNPDMIDEKGEYCCVHMCVQSCVETEVVIVSPSTLAQSYVNCVATLATLVLCHFVINMREAMCFLK